jgi:hypothetical protein
VRLRVTLEIHDPPADSTRNTLIPSAL